MDFIKKSRKIYLTNGGLIIDMKVYDDGIQLICKNNIEQNNAN